NRSVPTICEKIEMGELSLTNAAQVQSQLRKEDQRRKEFNQPKLTRQEKEKIIAKVENISTRQCEKVLAELLPEVQITVQEKTKTVAEGTLIQFVADDALMEKLEKLKNLMAHKTSGRWDELISELADVALKKMDVLAAKQTERETQAAAVEKSVSALGAQ